jgi:membrane protein
VSIYGLLANPQQIDRQMNSWLGSAPREVRQLLTAQLQSITRHAGAATGIGIAVGVLVALWSASSGVAHLIEATNVAYDEEETRGFVHRRLLALALTLGAALFIAVAVGLIAVLPSALARTGLGVSTRVLLGVARWVVLLVGMTLALAVLYRVAPDRPEPKWWWISPGALLATLIWLAASALFAVYTANFGKYNETYGALGAIVVLMLWLYITAFAILVGAELNAELEARATEG